MHRCPENAIDAQSPTLHGLFEAQAERTPQAIAVTCDEQHITYQALDARASQMAWRLRELGVGPETLVAVRIERSIDLIVAILAVLKAGGAYLPMDPTHPVERQRYVLDDAKPEVLLTQRSMDPISMPDILSLCMDADADKIRLQPTQRLPPLSTSSSLAYVIYTSGSTGKPKGVEITHHNVVRLFEVTQPLINFGADDVWSLFHSMAFDFSVFELFGALLYGGRVVVVPRETTRQPMALAALVEAEGVTILSQTPSAFQQLIPALVPLAAKLLLRRVIFAGEALEFSQLRPWIERFEENAPQLINMYGITETTVHATYRRVTREDILSARGSMIGQPLPDLDLVLLDDHLQPVAGGEEGEIFVVGPGVGRGYLGRPDLTAQRFFHLPDGRRAYRSGDRARKLANGDHVYVGRMDHQIKLHGYRIELGEIRSRLVAMSNVANAAVCCLGTGSDKRLVAYIEPVPGQPIAARQLRAQLMRQLPEYMIPAAFVFLDALPLTANGKLDLAALPSPRVERPPYRAPQTSTEQILARCLERALDHAQIGLDDSFVMLGGHSLKAAQVARDLQMELGRTIGIGALLADRTVADLAALLDQPIRTLADAPTSPAKIFVQSGRPKACANQLRLWLHSQRHPDDPAYNETLSLSIFYPVEVHLIEQCLAEVVERHELLRTAFQWRNGSLFQHSVPRVTLSLRVDDVSTLPEQDRAAKAKQLAEAQASVPFDLATPPLWRAHLIRLSEREHRLYITVHHAVCDARSLDNLAIELSTLYEAHTKGHTPVLCALPIRYAEAVTSALDAVQAEPSRSETNAVVTPSLPTDSPRTESISFAGSRHRFRIPASIAESLRQTALRQNATPFMVLLAAWHGLVYRYAGSEDAVVGTVVQQRMRTQDLPLIGPLFSMLAVRAQPNGDMPFEALLANVRAAFLSALANEGCKPPTATTEAAGLAFETVFGMLPPPPPLADGWQATHLDIGNGAAKYDLSLLLQEEAAGDIHGWIEYRSSLRTEASILRLVDHYVNLLASVSSDPRQRLADLDMLSESEHAQLLEWGHGHATTEVRTALAVHAVIAVQAQRTPDAIAIESVKGSLTYRQLIGRATAISDQLRQRGIGANSLVAICLEKSADLITGLLGILMAGGAFLPLDPIQPALRLTDLLLDARPSLVITTSTLQPHLAASMTPFLCLDALQSSEPSCAASGYQEVLPNSLAYVIYTSGSTGKPKGVQIEHGGLSNLIHQWQTIQRLTPESRVLQFARISFDAAVPEIFGSLSAGATLVLADDTWPLLGADLLTILRQRRITSATLPPSVLTTLPAADLPLMTTLIVASEDCPAEIVQRWSPGRCLLNAYGPTEVTVCATIAYCDPGQGKPPIGRPLADVDVYVLDTNQQPVPIGVPGELYIGGIGVGRGYLNQPELTAQRFVTLALGNKPPARFFRTGDRVRWREDGQLDFLGRMDRQIKLRGFRIEPAEIEAVLRQHPAVDNAVVEPYDDPAGHRALSAYVVMAEPGKADEQPTFWPSVAEYFVYDEYLYQAMSHDRTRNQAYRAALRLAVKDRVVLDVGTGAHATLARMCIEEGARTVYAVEIMDRSYRRAAECVRHLGLDHRIQVIHGDISTVQLPELADVCVSELVGSIGGSEGAAVLLERARRLLRPGGQMIPERSVTHIAAVQLPDEMRARPHMSEAGAHYAEAIFAELGQPCDLRLCIKNATQLALLSTSEPFETLDFTRPLQPHFAHDCQLRINRDGRVDGFLLWLSLEVGANKTVDILHQQHSWLPIFVPVSSTENHLNVRCGDTFHLTCSASLSEDGVHPDYRIHGSLHFGNGQQQRLEISLPHRPDGFRTTWLHRRLFGPSGMPLVLPSSTNAEAHLKAYLRSRVPDYMVPSAIVRLSAMPLTPHGKVDKKQLRQPKTIAERPTVPDQPDASIEARIAAIWKDVLHLTHIDLDTSFFDLGGTSLLLAKIQERLTTVIGRTVPIPVLFQHVTVRSLVAHLNGDVKVDPTTSAEARAKRLRDMLARRSDRSNSRDR